MVLFVIKAFVSVEFVAIRSAMVAVEVTVILPAVSEASVETPATKLAK